MLADLRGGRAFLAAELSRPGWLDFGAFRWRDLALAQGVRAAIGVLTPLVIGVATGRVEYGSFAALGALPAGFVSFRGVNRTRVLAVLCASAGMAVSTFAGATAAREPRLLILVVFAWAYAVGLLAALGPTVLAVTLQWPVALLIASALPLGPADAALRAGLVLAGGLWQCLLVVTSWTVNRGSAERAALAATYTSLADYAGRLAAGELGPPSPSQLAARQALDDPNPLVRTAARQHMRDLADEAERIRSTLTALSIAGDDGRPAPDVRALLGAGARVLSELAAGLDRRSGQRDEHLAAARHVLDGVTTSAGTTWRWAGEALLGQLRSASRIVDRLNYAEPATRRAPPPRPIRQTWRLDTLLTLRASVGTSSESGRHALRLAVVTAVAEAIVQAADFSHGYWAVLTIFIVLRADYSSTLYRGLQRAAGTLAGAGLGLATVQLARISLTALLAGIGVSLLAAYAVFTVNYLLYGVFLTDFVVVLLALLGLPPEPTALARLAGTGLGTALAILAYLLWPTWEGTSAAEKFARLFAAQGRYAGALLRAYSRPGGPELARLGQLRIAARRARIDAEASADRLAGEPDHPPVTVRSARTLESAGHRIAQACVALGAVVTAHHAANRAAIVAAADLQNGLDLLADGVTESAGQLAAALRAAGPQGPRPPASLPQLHALQRVIWLRLADQDAQPAGAEAGLLAATDSLVDAINTAAHALGG
ncbi:MAG: FUSC family protein [Streptosporangiaceae bacterium]